MKISEKLAEKLADENCAECGGTGVITVGGKGDEDDDYCLCVKTKRAENQADAYDDTSAD